MYLSDVGYFVQYKIYVLFLFYSYGQRALKRIKYETRVENGSCRVLNYIILKKKNQTKQNTCKKKNSKCVCSQVNYNLNLKILTRKNLVEYNFFFFFKFTL